MKLEIRGKDLEITNTVHTYAQRRLNFALDRFAEGIRNVWLKVEDINSSRGGVDKRCQLTISLVHASPMTLESRASTVEGAIHRIARKVGSLVERRFRRRQEHRRFSKAARYPLLSSPVATDKHFEENYVMKPPRKRVLIADCHEDVLITLERLLEDAGFDTTTVWTANEALKLMQSHPFDLVLVNEYFPDAEFKAVLKALRKRGGQAPCIIMQSSAAETVDFTRFEGLGADDVVCKHRFGQIVETVRECLVCDEKRLPAA